MDISTALWAAVIGAGSGIATIALLGAFVGRRFRGRARHARRAGGPPWAYAGGPHRGPHMAFAGGGHCGRPEGRCAGRETGQPAEASSTAESGA